MDKKSTTGGKRKLSAETVNMITAIAAEYAVKKYREEQEAKRESLKDKRYRNTKLLLKKYRQLSDYQANAVYSTAQLLSDQANDVLSMLGVDNEDRYEVGRIRDSVVVTKVIMEHVDTMLECYRQKCDASGKPEVRRRWRIIRDMYISPEQKPVQDIADAEHISVSMAYQDISIACDELSSLFFGLDLSEFWS